MCSALINIFLVQGKQGLLLEAPQTPQSIEIKTPFQCFWVFFPCSRSTMRMAPDLLPTCSHSESHQQMFPSNVDCARLEMPLPTSATSHTCQVQECCIFECALPAVDSQGHCYTTLVFLGKCPLFLPLSLPPGTKLAHSIFLPCLPFQILMMSSPLTVWSTRGCP